MTDQSANSVKKRLQIPYGRQSISEQDVEEVVQVLRSDWLTTGPKVGEFERSFAGVVGAEHAVAVSSGTAALHATMYALGIGPGDEVIVPTMTFVATANSVVYQGGKPVFCDVEPDTLLVDPSKVEEKITPKTKAIVAVDYAGQPCDYDALDEIASDHEIPLVADACHSLGGAYKSRPVGGLATLSAFSFHPVKNITTAEGGIITTDNGELAQRMRQFRNHGITTDHRERERRGSWEYDMVGLGYNYRLSDLHAALGCSQLEKLPEFLKSRQDIAAKYTNTLRSFEGLQLLSLRENVEHAFHLYVIRLDMSVNRDSIVKSLWANGVKVNVHYSPVHLHSFYRNRFGTRLGDLPTAEAVADTIVSLPVFPTMTEEEQSFVIDTLKREVTSHRQAA